MLNFWAPRLRIGQGRTTVLGSRHEQSLAAVTGISTGSGPGLSTATTIVENSVENYQLTEGSVTEERSR